MNGWGRGVYEGHSRHSSGMSLMEITIIVTILDVLAAIVLSRLIFVTDEARAASVTSLRVAFTGGINGAHNQWLAQSQPQKINVGGVDLAMNNTGWPEATSSSANGHVNPEKCLEVWNAVMENPPIAGVTCKEKCIYAVTVAQAVSSNRIECVYTNRLGGEDNRIYYDMATGFVH